MTEPNAEQAVQRAREALALERAVPAEIWEVFPPAGEAPTYLLVVLGERDAPTGLAAVDPRTSEVLSSARLPGSRPHMSVGSEEAAERAGIVGGVARLVWTPSRQSRSQLYPVWQVRGGDRIAYVDLQGGVWPALYEEGRGGAR